MKQLIAVVMLVSVLLSGCAGGQRVTPTEEKGQQAPEPTEGTVPVLAETGELFTQWERSGAYAEEESALIRLEGDSASCDSNAVEIKGSTVTILDEGTYILTGTLSDGTVIVHGDKEDQTQLVLSNARINNSTGAAIYIAQADKVMVTLAEGTDNQLSNGGTFQSTQDNAIDGVIYSKEDLILNGTGSLNIESPAGHGIVSKDILKGVSGCYTIRSAEQGMAGKDGICIAGGQWDIQAGKDGIHGENDEDTTLGNGHITGGSFAICAEGDGISVSGMLQITGGSFDIITGGGSENAQKETSENWGHPMGGMGGHRPGGSQGGRPGETVTTTQEDSTSIKGVKAAGDLIVTGGSFVIDAADDAVHSNSDLMLRGGSFQIATGDDGFHADGTLTVWDGQVVITESYEGLEALQLVINGGEITLTAGDDGLNAAGGTDQSGFGGIRGDRFGGMGGASDGSIVIAGGTLSIAASGDGIDSNGSLTVTGGNITVCGPVQGDTATLDYDTTARISGGTFIGTGASGMAQTFESDGQGVVSVSTGTQPAGTRIVLTDQEGREILAYTPALSFSCVILSSPELLPGELYTITVGSQSGTVTAR